MTEIVFTDGHTEEYPVVRTQGGFAHCFEKTYDCLDPDDFSRKLYYYLTLVLWVSLLLYQPTHTKVKSVPESEIEEVK